MPRRRSEKRRTNKRRVTKGGSGTASWAPYGLADQQSRGGEGNLIQVNANAPVKMGGGLATLSPAMVGGKKQQQGAGILNDLALPAMLIYANNAYGKGRSTRSTIGRRRSFSRRRSASRRR